MPEMKISLVIPIRNESESIRKLIESIEIQTLPPDEIIIVDGGSVDDTRQIVKSLIDGKARYKLIETEDATPGRGRNIGIEQAKNEWIALTDAGIFLDENWLKNLAATLAENPSADLVYGNFEPSINSLFEKCAAITYVPSRKKDSIRGNFIASSLMKKSLWEKVDGFPDFRAAEDLTFMEEVIKNNFHTVTAPKALVHWQIQSDLLSTFHKFVLYSKHNVIAAREWDWHYGLLKQYLFLLPFLILAIWHSYWWWLVIVLWIIARVIKRISSNYYQFGLTPLYNPIQFFTIVIIIISIDIATLIGWIQAKIK